MDVADRVRRVDALLRRLWDTRKGIKAVEKLYLAAIGEEEEAAEIVPPLTRGDVKEWTRDEPRRQRRGHKRLGNKSICFRAAANNKLEGKGRDEGEGEGRLGGDGLAGCLNHSVAGGSRG